MKLKLKVTEICNANCTCCQQRLERYADDSTYVMPLELAQKCINEAVALGWNQLILSGGEPTLHPNLFEIIKYGHEHGMSVSLYTNGSKLSNDYIDNLRTSGLDVLMLSYYSFDKDIFCSIRQSEEIYIKATEALYRLKEKIEKENLPIRIRLQSILSKENYSSFPDLIQFAIDAKFESMSVSYLEHAQTKPELYMDKNDVNIFNTIYVPAIKKILSLAQLTDESNNHNVQVLSNLFCSTYSGEKVNVYKGEYRTESIECVNKNNYIVVNPEGNTLPCCGCEYYDERTSFGNVYKRSLSDILLDIPMQTFWNTEKQICKYCAVDRHFYFAIK